LKGDLLCQEVTEQAQLVKDQVQVGVWVEAKAKVEAEWVELLQQDRAEIAYAQTAAQQCPTLLDSHAIT